MSQPNSNHPQFQYTVHQAPDQYPFAVHVSQANNRTWPSRLSSGQRNISSPSVSVRSAITDSSRRSFDIGNSQQASISPIDSRIDPNLFLNTLDHSGHVIRNSYDEIGQNYREEESWNAFNLRTVGDDQTRPDPVHSSFKGYRAGPGSIGSVAPISDSGFYSQSVLSNEPGRFNQELPPSINSQVDNMHVSLGPREVSELGRVPSDQRSHASSRSGRQDKHIQCPECSSSLKCKSDFKKHMLKHRKPFMCEEPGCKRQGHGFSTVNDLDRHRKSVHRVGLLKKSYQCASESCRNKEKIWPRLDNFKQHIERMHKEEDHIELIKRSTYVPPKIPQTISENDVVAPMETVLAGMENSFSNHERYDFGAPTAIPDQDIGHWPSGMPMEDLQTQESQPSSGMPRSSPRSSLSLSRLSQGRSKVSKLHKQGGSIRRELYDSSKTTHEDVARQTMKPQLDGLAVPPMGKSHPKISREAQTKAQQQRQALQKLSKAVTIERHDSPQAPVDLEETILRILSSAKNSGSGSGQSQSHGDAAFLSKSEAIRAVQAISNLIKQSPGSAYSQPRRVQPSTTADPKVCMICGYAVARACDLKKHLRRHEKPFGCTYPKCHKRFGAKSDWKRHENSQHFQLEAYRCRRLDSEGQVCGKHYFRSTQFENHLETRHGVSSKQERQIEAKERKIGKNCQGQFWCGFCVDIIPLGARKNAAWDERFDHIANHLQGDDKTKKKIEEWVCVEENKTKQELLKEIDRYVFDDDDEREVDVPGETNDHPPPPVSADMSRSPMSAASSAPPMMRDSIMNHNGKRLSQSSPQMSRKRNRKVKMTISYCCRCQDQFNTLTQSCMNLECGHVMCDTCPIETREVIELDGGCRG